MLTSKLEKEINTIWKTRDSLNSNSNKRIIELYWFAARDKSLINL